MPPAAATARTSRREDVPVDTYGLLSFTTVDVARVRRAGAGLLANSERVQLDAMGFRQVLVGRNYQPAGWRH